MIGCDYETSVLQDVFNGFFFLAFRSANATAAFSKPATLAVTSRRFRFKYSTDRVPDKRPRRRRVNPAAGRLLSLALSRGPRRYATLFLAARRPRNRSDPGGRAISRDEIIYSSSSSRHNYTTTTADDVRFFRDRLLARRCADGAYRQR